MTDPQDIAKLAESREYKQFVRRRARFAWAMTGAICFIYFGYVLLIAFRPSWLAAPIGSGVTSWGIPAGIGVILAGIGLTAIYVRRANREFDPEIQRLRRDYEA